MVRGQHRRLSQNRLEGQGDGLPSQAVFDRSTAATNRTFFWFRNRKASMKSSDKVLHTVHSDGAASFNIAFPFLPIT